MFGDIYRSDRFLGEMRRIVPFDAFCNDPNKELDLRARNVAFGARHFLEELLPRLAPRVQLALLAYCGAPVAGVIFVDFESPLLGLVIPGEKWSPLGSVVREWGNALWASDFKLNDNIRELGARVDSCNRQCELLDRHSLTVIPSTRLRLFDAESATDVCPFLLAEVRFAGASVPAALPLTHDSGSERSQLRSQ